MNRQRPDPSEFPADLGPLFRPRLRELAGATDQPTSVRAAATVLADGTADVDSRLLLTLIENHPGSTMEGLGQHAAALHGGDPFRWRIKLGRRTGPLKRADLIHATDGSDGLALWWSGPGMGEFS